MGILTRSVIPKPGYHAELHQDALRALLTSAQLLAGTRLPGCEWHRRAASGAGPRRSEHGDRGLPGSRDLV